ncbi:hypothetical protein [Desulfobulbus oligotrophicus]|uniref:Uncharacterized protein n=1 Tax=Desulfobulbus oligotrophicus TaxID=1909699 RepID=A0A7T6AR96_9BACT|nr:hypothetical protein [Desulfobulbus oligotrophicus]MDY0391619.1 hypothetical protein [Desulfobulbus oligotrophicus]QQG66638.1 hypothetical protein HP555_12550 [Desulfobulbus oligotrophicus]
MTESAVFEWETLVIGTSLLSGTEEVHRVIPPYQCMDGAGKAVGESFDDPDAVPSVLAAKIQ